MRLEAGVKVCRYASCKTTKNILKRAYKLTKAERNKREARQYIGCVLSTVSYEIIENMYSLPVLAHIGDFKSHA